MYRITVSVKWGSAYQCLHSTWHQVSSQWMLTTISSWCWWWWMEFLSDAAVFWFTSKYSGTLLSSRIFCDYLNVICCPTQWPLAPWGFWALAVWVVQLSDRCFPLFTSNYLDLNSHRWLVVAKLDSPALAHAIDLQLVCFCYTYMVALRSCRAVCLQDRQIDKLLWITWGGEEARHLVFVLPTVQAGACSEIHGRK